MDENVKKILFDAAESIYERTGIKLHEVKFEWLYANSVGSIKFILTEAKFDGSVS